MKKTIKDINIKNKKVIVRVDFNVPLDENLNITDDTRIKESIQTIKYLLQENAKIILMSHLGRPKGKIEPKYSLKPVAKRLSELLGIQVKMAPGCVDPETKKMASELKNGEILLLENLRFNSGEEKNDDKFAKELSSLGDVFVQDAFGTVHRAHASTEGIVKFIKESVCGFLLEKEITYFDKVLKSPEKPFIAILGGVKVSDKIGVIENLLDKVNALIIGGAMAYTFLKAKGIRTGASLIEQDKIDVAKDTMKKAYQKNINLLLPIDHVIATKVDKDAQVKEISTVDIPDGWMGVDIGNLTINRAKSIITAAKTIVWNGPMGVFEIDKFSNGTKKIAEFVSETTQTKKAISIVGGGDTVSAVKKANVSDKISHISTGGGASLELLEGKILPGIKVLPDK